MRPPLTVRFQCSATLAALLTAFQFSFRFTEAAALQQRRVAKRKTHILALIHMHARVHASTPTPQVRGVGGGGWGARCFV